MCRFYGLSPREIMEMENEYAMILWQSMPLIDAQEKIGHIQAVSFPHLKPGNRSKIEANLQRIAHPNAEAREATWEDLAGEIGQTGIRAEDG